MDISGFDRDPGAAAVVNSDPGNPLGRPVLIFMHARNSVIFIIYNPVRPARIPLLVDFLDQRMSDGIVNKNVFLPIGEIRHILVYLSLPEFPYHAAGLERNSLVARYLARRGKAQNGIFPVSYVGVIILIDSGYCGSVRIVIYDLRRPSVFDKNLLSERLAAESVNVNDDAVRACGAGLSVIIPPVLNNRSVPGPVGNSPDRFVVADPVYLHSDKPAQMVGRAHRILVTGIIIFIH